MAFPAALHHWHCGRFSELRRELMYCSTAKTVNIRPCLNNDVEKLFQMVVFTELVLLNAHFCPGLCLWLRIP